MPLSCLCLIRHSFDKHMIKLGLFTQTSPWTLVNRQADFFPIFGFLFKPFVAKLNFRTETDIVMKFLWQSKLDTENRNILKQLGSDFTVPNQIPQDLLFHL